MYLSRIASSDPSSLYMSPQRFFRYCRASCLACFFFAYSSSSLAFGFGIQIVDEQEAQETLELVNAMSELVEEDQLTTNPAEAY